MARADVVLNTVGPFFKFGPPILKAAIECGCHYLDICDDWEPTLEMLAMDAAAREAGLTAVVGMGASPGISNVLAFAAMSELDTVNTVYTGWNMNAVVPEEETSQEGVSAAMLHAIQQLTGTVRVQRNGTSAMVRPLDKLSVDYPGVGHQSVFVFGHPEAVTVPHHYPDVQTSYNVVHGLEKDETMIRGLRWLMEHKILSVPRAATLLGWLEKRSPIQSVADLLGPDRLPPLYALAVGRKDGTPASAAAAIVDMPETSMGYATGAPLAVGLELLFKGRITRRGVFAPESGAIAPIDFFTALHAKAQNPRGSAAEMTLISRSWDADAKDRFAAAVARVLSATESVAIAA